MPCAKHEAEIKTLFEKSKETNIKIDKNEDAINKRVDGVETMRDLLYSLDKNMALQTQLMERSMKHDEQQDIKMSEFQQAMSDFQNVVVSMNINLTKLNEGQSELTDRVDSIENKVEQNEGKHLVDLRDIEKDKKVNLLKKYGEPAVIIVAVGTILLKVIEMFKG